VVWPKPDTKPDAPILIAAYTQGGHAQRCAVRSRVRAHRPHGG
jgi:hypothetical protein